MPYIVDDGKDEVTIDKINKKDIQDIEEDEDMNFKKPKLDVTVFLDKDIKRSERNYESKIEKIKDYEEIIVKLRDECRNLMSEINRKKKARDLYLGTTEKKKEKEYPEPESVSEEPKSDPEPIQEVPENAGS